MIDLHSHTNESDGSSAPLELIDRALRLGLEALAITDHDTFAGYEQARTAAANYGLDLVCGIELSTRMAGERKRTVHLLGYFLRDQPTADFCAWLDQLQESRRERNSRLAEKLQGVGVRVELREVEALGKTLTGRPHFARVLVRKGYASNSEEAFRKYLGESAPSYVEREGPDVETGIRRILGAGGLPVLAHPVRLGFREPIAEEACIARLRSSGLGGIEVYHSDHEPVDTERYMAIAKKYGLAITGGSDYHGDAKPQIELGRGYNGNVNVPLSVLQALRGL